ncbi:MAG: rhomboid family intramembrane serine protease [Prevotella sp.]|nr:rhomboid family intramembrane serine protease [Prevotella sp.]
MFRNIPIVTKNLLIINVVAYLASLFIQIGGESLVDWGALHFFMASDFHLYQFITYQFLHGGFTHLFFNMFALWMFGCVIENVWGPKKFIFYYIFCGIGAGICQELVQYVQFAADGLTSMNATDMLNVNGTHLMTVDQVMNLSSTIGASGAVYAILLAFGMTFPNERIFIFPLPVPIKAKWFVVIYAGIEMFSAMASAGDGIAHMAHLGGMLFGFLLIMYWRKHGSRFDLNRSRQFFDRWSKTGASKYSGNSSYAGNTTFSGNAGNTSYSRPETDMEYNARKKALQDEIDAILDKIRKSGYDSLTKAEKQRLFEASHAK